MFALSESRKKLSERVPEPAEKEETEDIPIRYIGQAFKLFLICERGDELYLVDQHAAHERILYDELLSQKTVQPLLVPIRIEADAILDEFLSGHREYELCAAESPLDHVRTKCGIQFLPDTAYGAGFYIAKMRRL